jgi:hypothetical protein
VRWSRVHVALAVALTLPVAVACAGGEPPRSVAPGGVPQVLVARPSPPAGETTAPPAASPEPAYVPPTPTPAPEPLPSGLAPDIVAAVAWRRETGLRSDPAWVLQVAGDPTASTFWAHPILPEEEAFIWARQERLQPFVGLVQRHAAEYPDEYGGLYLDNANSRIASLWTANLALHQSAIRELTGADAPIVVLPVRWSKAELRAVQDGIDPHWPGFATVAAAPQGFSEDIPRNLVSIHISSANPDAPQLIRERLAATLGVPVEMLEVTSDGTGVELLPSGTVKGIVLLADGSRPGRNELMVDGRADAIGYCGGGDIGYGVGESGRFEIPCKVGTYTIEIRAPAKGDGEWVVVGRARVVVGADQVSTVRIRLVRGAHIRG